MRSNWHDGARGNEIDADKYPVDPVPDASAYEGGPGIELQPFQHSDNGRAR